MHTFSLTSASWRFRDAATKAWFPATVPGCVHTDLLAAGKIDDPFFGTNELQLGWIERKNWEYAAEFNVSNELLQNEVVELVSDGLDTIATVRVNGRTIGESDNMFVSHRWDVKPLLRAGKNQISVLFRSAVEYIENTRTEFTPPKEYCDPVGNSVRIRKQPCQFGWDWGPRLVTAGIWRDLRIEGWNKNRLAHVRITQQHDTDDDGSVILALAAELARPDKSVEIEATCWFEGREVARAKGNKDSLKLKIAEPKLWWPAGQGAQPLYDIVISGRLAGEEVGLIKKKVGLRTIVLDRHADQWGETFQFLVNGRPVFIKGANWIPPHSFVANLQRRDYERDLNAAVEANMNCVRLWGGGIYESEHFYDICDERGLLVWHDFMFACALYPSDRKFLDSVNREAIDQVKRIHHRACLALWCGNNEVPQLNGQYMREKPALRKGYEKLFHKLLPEVVARHDGTTAYWPSSEWRGVWESGHSLGEKSGDSHFWDVWHARHPVKDYEKWAFRFCSEFGMQSYSSSETNATFCPPDDGNIFGPSMENHQKNRLGNQVILDYVSRRYRLPKTQDDLIYLSQINQAYCMQTGVEHYRRLMPRCMGSIYWQLNDCWPVASWSSIEFTGRWKALQFAARRFYAPALICAHVDGDEEATIGNYRRSTIRKMHLYTVYDAPETARGILRWELRHFDGRLLEAAFQSVTLKPRQSVRQRTLDLALPLRDYGRDNLYVALSLAIDGVVMSRQTVFLAPPRFLRLPKGPISCAVKWLSPSEAVLKFRSKVFQHAVEFAAPGCPHNASDNYFDLYPNEAREITLKFNEPVAPRKFQKQLRIRSLTDTFD
ncbi:MAG TPA: glycoside hydrolase family 2 protein [Opitutaceae bacterium]|nr:glycoside hydrolase family 2 protein [Opitutaceae bacterium]